METYGDFSENQKERIHRKKLNTKSKNEKVEKSSFNKENAKRHRKNDAKKLVNRLRADDFHDYDDYDYDYEVYERFNKR